MRTLIAGAGPTGLVLALELARRGIAFDIISAAPGPGTTSRAIAIHARTLEFYEQLGFADEILALGSIMQSVRIRHDGMDLATIALGEIGQDLSRFPFVFSLAQDDHERFLIGKLRELGAEVQWNCPLVSFEQAAGHVTVAIAQNDAVHSADYAYVCGCDGARSAVRHATGVSFDGGTYDGLFYVADVEIAGAHPGELVANLGAGTFALMLPVRRDGGVRLVGIAGDKSGEPTFEELKPGIEAVIGERVDRLNWFSTYRVHHRVVGQFRDRRCFLLGDAAHLHSPAGGQGMNTGIGDAVNLAWKLAAVLKGEARDALLDTYDAERRPFALALVATTDRIFEWMVDKGLVGQLLRRVLVPQVAPIAMRFEAARTAFFRRVSQIAISYRDSPLSRGKAGNIGGGDRFPFVADQCHDAKGCRTLGWTAHMFGTAPAEVAAVLADGSISLSTRSWTSAAKRAGLTCDVLYLVRPDGYIGMVLANPSAAAISAYLADIEAA